MNLLQQVERLVVYCDPLTSGAIGAASNMVHSKQQMLLLDQTKTVVECAQQLLYVTKECGGNPKVPSIINRRYKTSKTKQTYKGRAQALNIHKFLVLNSLRHNLTKSDSFVNSASRTIGQISLVVLFSL